jgi:hypothetical protein
MACPAPDCPTDVQPLEPTTGYVQQAMDYAANRLVDVPLHGPAALTWLGLIAHAMTVHPDLDLEAYLQTYLDQ